MGDKRVDLFDLMACKGTLSLPVLIRGIIL